MNPTILASRGRDLYIRYVPIPAKYMNRYTLIGTRNTSPRSTAQEARRNTEFVAVLKKGAKLESFKRIGGNV